MKRVHLVLILLGVIVCGIVLYRVVRPNSVIPVFESVTVERGSIVNNVSVTGHIEPVTRISLAFPFGGRLARLYIVEGEHVTKNTLIAELDSGVLQSALTEAETRVAHERAVLQSILAPLRTEERALKNASVVNAETALTRSEESTRTLLDRVFVQVDDAIHEGIDELFKNTQSDNPDLGVTFAYGSTRYVLRADPVKESILNEERRNVESILANMKLRLSDSTFSVDEALVATSKDLVAVENFLTTLAEVINKYKATDTYDQSVYESFQLSVSTARMTVSATRLEVTNVYTSYSTALSGLSLALRDLELATAGASSEAITTQEASLASAEAGVQTARKRVEEVELRAPVNGVLSRIDFESGEIVGPYTPVAELMTEGVFEVEAYIPEADITQVKLGNQAEITFDAFDRNAVFKAEVVRIALSETVRDGVPTYKTTLRLLDEEREGMVLRPGMTADIEILTDTRENVLYVPIRSVLQDGIRSYVNIFDGKEFKERNVETGLRGSSGTIEIISGVNEGEEIVLYVE
jgi:multidrug efflux pump subunit AcrA (membrane-fusion protein)